VTNDVIKQTRKKSIGDQERILREHGCRMPTLIEAAVLLLTTYVKSSKYLLNSGTYTRCCEKVLQLQTAVGGFTASGFKIDRSAFDDEGDGVVAVRKL